MYHPKGLYYHLVLEETLLEKITNNLEQCDVEKNINNTELDNKNRRDCKISWIRYDENNVPILEIFNIFWNLCDHLNLLCNWNFDITFLESIQYTKYTSGDFYDWHIDVIKTDETTVRKLSMVLLLDDNFEGGKFQLETKIPFPDNIVDSRYETIPLQKGSLLIFHSDMPHRVTPVISGVRKTLVIWANGPSFK